MAAIVSDKLNLKMKIKNFLFIIFVLNFILDSCFENSSHKRFISDKYYLSKMHPMFWTLYYKIDNKSGIGRVDYVRDIGWTDKYIFVRNINSFYFLDKTKDNEFLNNNEIVLGPFTKETYDSILDSLKINDFKFQLSLD